MTIDILYDNDKQLYYVENKNCIEANKRGRVAFPTIETAMMYMKALSIMEFNYQPDPVDKKVFNERPFQKEEHL